MSQTLVRYDVMCRAIAECHAIDEVKDIRDKARAIAEYARRANDTDLERKVCEIRVKAERRVGELLRGVPKANGARGQPGPGRGKTASLESTPFYGVQHPEVSPPPTHPPLLSDYGISRDQSSLWQKLADVPEPDFQEGVANPMALPNAKDIVAAHEAKHAPPGEWKPKVDDRALWLWGKLKDFEREGLLAVHPDELIDTMLGHMKETTRELAPKVAAWLQRISP